MQTLKIIQRLNKADRRKVFKLAARMTAAVYLAHRDFEYDEEFNAFQELFKEVARILPNIDCVVDFNENLKTAINHYGNKLKLKPVKHGTSDQELPNL